MRRLTSYVCVAMLLIVLAVPMTAGAAEEPLTMTPDELVTIDRDLDGTLVRFAGEAIGEDLRSGSDHRWVNVLGESTAIGVYVDNAMAEKVSVFGDHTHQGDTVEVIGIVNIGCDQHAGEFDVHAESFEIFTEGGTVDRPFAPWKGIAAVGLFIVALIEYRFLVHLRASSFKE